MLLPGCAIVGIWFDNSYRRRFAPTLHETNTPLNFTTPAFAVVAQHIEYLWGFATIPAVQTSTVQVPKALRRNYTDLLRVINTLQNGIVPLQDMRCPLDIRRFVRIVPLGTFCCFRSSKPAHKKICLRWLLRPQKCKTIHVVLSHF